MKKHVKIEENYYLVSQQVNSNVTVDVAKNVDFIFKIDVSGSMSSELELIRQQLKNRLPSLTKMGDRVTIIWFSGKDEAGILVESVEIKSLKTFDTLNSAIDKWLRPIGMTAFKKPYVLMKEVIERIKKNRPDAIFSSIFLSDGGNNSVAWSEVIKALKDVENDLAASLIVEYGYYADTQKLTEMAGILGAEKVSCSSFDDYEPVFEKKLTSSVHSGKKSLVEITDKYLYDFVFSVGNDGSVVLYNITDNKVLVGGDVKEVHFFSPTAIGELSLPHYPKNETLDATMYAAIYVLSDKLLNDSAEKIFYALGDNFHYKMLVNAFGKQKLNAFKTAIKECVADTAKRFPDGLAKIEKVDENAYCLMNLISDLGNVEDCLFYPNHPDFEYNRIGRKRIAKGSELSEADKVRLSEAKNVEEATNILKELAEKNVDVKFVNTEPDRGYLLTDLVWNEERANLSVRIRIDGKVVLPKNKFKIDEVLSYKYRTFTLIKDGIVNVEKIPVSYSFDLERLLVAKKVNYALEFDKQTKVPHTIIIDLTSLPLINKGMVKSISANELAKQEWELQKLQADKKVYDYYKKSLFPKSSETFAQMLGQEAADWLKEIGVTDYNGFAPKTDAEESTDFYMSVNLVTKIKGLSALPKVEDVVAKIKLGATLKLNELVMADAINKYLEQTKSDIYKSLSEEQQKEVLSTYLNSKSNELNKKKRKAMQEISQIKFSLILSKKWFKEFKSFDENTLDIKLDDQNLTFVFDLCEKEVKI